MDIILYNIIVGLSCLIFGYFFGSIPTGLIVGKVFYGRDPREDGSKNMGGTNVGRLFGKKAGVATIVLDMFKIMIPTAVIWTVIKFSGLNQLFVETFDSGLWDNGIFYIYLTPIGVSIGHVFPIFAGFRGGKTVSVYAGIGTLTSWVLFILGSSVFFVTLKKTKYVSLGSILMSIVGIAVSWLMFGLTFVLPEAFSNVGMNGNGLFMVCGWEYATCITFIGLLLIAKHHGNIVRIANGTERKISWMK